MSARSFKRWGLPLLFTTALCGCGRNTGLTLKILMPPCNPHPFAGAATVVLTVQGDQTSA